jgi:type I restriction enzyme S subunit
MNKYETYKPTIDLWIGEIPKNWSLKRLKWVTKIENSGIWGEDEEFENSIKVPIPTTGQLSIDGEWYYDKMNLRHLSLEDWEKYKCVEGDIVVVKSSGSSTNIITGKSGYISKENSSKFGFSNFLLRVRPHSVNSKFVYYFLSSNLTKQRIERMVSSTTYPNLKVDEYSNSELPIPSTFEQNQIVHFLDTKTELIDKLISNKERKISLLKEKTKSIINQFVTKGLNPNEIMKDSGVEWIGVIPEKWDFVKIGHYTNVVRGGSPRPSGDPRYFNGDFIHWITVKEVTSKHGKYIVDTDTKLTEEGMKQSRVLEPETLVLSNSGATLGVPGILKIKGCINDGVVSFLNISPLVYRDYLYYFWTTQTSILLEQQSGYGQPNLNIDIVSNIRFPLPPVNEQLKIVELLDTKTKEIDDLIQLEQKKIDLLKEYRQSLISEVVTGKIKVTTDE